MTAADLAACRPEIWKQCGAGDVFPEEKFRALPWLALGGAKQECQSLSPFFRNEKYKIYKKNILYTYVYAYTCDDVCKSFRVFQILSAALLTPCKREPALMAAAALNLTERMGFI